MVRRAPRVPGLLLAAAFAAVLLVPSAAAAAPVSPPNVPLGHLPGAPPTARAAVWPLSAIPRNLTSLAGEAVPATSTLPVSALSAVPAPTPPPTTPVVMTVLANSTTCCVQANFTAPNGTWAMIVLNYTGEAIGGVYDSSYRAYVDQVQVLFGTTPEYGQWNVAKDVTAYSVLFRGTFNFTFLLGAATVGGYFTSSVSLEFYPVPAGAAPPVEPNVIVPLWHRVFASTTTPSLAVSATVPQNVTNATLELWTYGFGPDEFWYTSQPNLRDLLVSVDGRPIVSVLPFPYINTGGDDLFAWRPITAAFTLSDPGYAVDVTGALGLIEGAHNFTANLTGVTPGSSWLIGGALLLTTSPQVTGATSDAYAFSATPPTISTDHLTYYDESAAFSYRYVSTIASSTGATTAADFVNETYSSDMRLTTNWQNLSAIESTLGHELRVTGGVTTSTVTSLAFPFTMDAGSYLVETSTTGGGYPIYANFSSYLVDLRQEWDASASTFSTVGNLTTLDASTTLDNRVTSSNDAFSGTEKLISSSAAELLSITFIEAATTNEFTLTAIAPGVATSYGHLLVGSSYQPAPPNSAETILVDAVANPLSVSAATSLPVLDLGGTTTFRVTPSGGAPPYSYFYSGLPLGCSTANVSALPCTPSVMGAFDVYVTVTDSAGVSGPPTLLPLVVEPSLSVSLVATSTALDLTENATVSATISGGTPPYTCLWLVNGTAVGGPTANCSTPLVYGLTSTGIYTFSLEVTDGGGAVLFAAPVNVSVGQPPSVALAIVAGASTILVGSGATVNASVVGGTAPLLYRWFLNGTAVAGAGGSNFTFLAPAPGVYRVTVQVTDGTGAVGVSPPLAFDAVNASPPATASPTPSFLASGTGEAVLLVIGLAVGLVIGVVVLRARGRRAAGP